MAKKLTKKEADDYDKAIDRMKQRMDQWRKDNPTVTAEVIFNGKVFVIGGIQDALLLHLVKVNKGGYEMLKFMCEPERNEPTVTMVRFVIEGAK